MTTNPNPTREVTIGFLEPDWKLRSKTGPGFGIGTEPRLDFRVGNGNKKSKP
jgi:hypothetical protein